MTIIRQIKNSTKAIEDIIATEVSQAERRGFDAGFMAAKIACMNYLNDKLMNARVDPIVAIQWEQFFDTMNKEVR